jgi:hypothetical protein
METREMMTTQTLQMELMLIKSVELYLIIMVARITRFMAFSIPIGLLPEQSP